MSISKKIGKAALLGGLATAAIAATVGVAAPANASAAHITTVVWVVTLCMTIGSVARDTERVNGGNLS
jgi:hypothetical protein